MVYSIINMWWLCRSQKTILQCPRSRWGGHAIISISPSYFTSFSETSTLAGVARRIEASICQRCIQSMLNPHHPRLRVSWHLVYSGQWLAITYSVMWYQTGQNSSSGGEGKLCIKNHEEGNGKPSHLIFP